MTQGTHDRPPRPRSCLFFVALVLLEDDIIVSICHPPACLTLLTSPVSSQEKEIPSYRPTNVPSHPGPTRPSPPRLPLALLHPGAIDEQDRRHTACGSRKGQRPGSSGLAAVGPAGREGCFRYERAHMVPRPRPYPTTTNQQEAGQVGQAGRCLETRQPPSPLNPPSHATGTSFRDISRARTRPGSDDSRSPSRQYRSRAGFMASRRHTYLPPFYSSRRPRQKRKPTVYLETGSLFAHLVSHSHSQGVHRQMASAGRMIVDKQSLPSEL